MPCMLHCIPPVYLDPSLVGYYAARRPLFQSSRAASGAEVSMNVRVVDAAVPVPRTSRAPIVVLTLAGIASVIFVGGFALPYFLSSSHGPVQYAPKRGWLLLHIGGGIAAL